MLLTRNTSCCAQCPNCVLLSDWIYHKSAEKIYDILTATGADDNDSPIEATDRVDYLPKLKAFLGVELRSKN